MTEGESLVHYAYKEIFRGLLEGKFAPGEKLQIAKIKKDLSVGATPIREALSLLEATELIQREDNRGFRVKRVGKEDILDLYATLLCLEKLLLEQALEQGDASWEGKIVDTLHQLATLEKGGRKVETTLWAETNGAFHSALVSGCPSPLLRKLRDKVYLMFQYYSSLSFLSTSTSLEEIHKEHILLAEAALERDQERVDSLLESHLHKSLQDVLQALQDRGVLA